MHRNRAGSRRSKKTDTALREALSELIHEKPYDDIVVKEILGRANVGRSTFYAHYRDKQDLLLSGFQDVLQSARPVTSSRDVLWFSRPILDHIQEERSTRKSSLDRARRTAIHRHLVRTIAERVEADAKVLRRRKRTTVPVPERVLAMWIASTFGLVLDWWAECESPPDAPVVDQMMRQLIEPALREL